MIKNSKSKPLTGNVSNDMAKHAHKVIALLMHEFELTEFKITVDNIMAFRREYDGELPTVVFEESMGVIRVKLMDHREARQKVQ